MRAFIVADVRPFGNLIRISCANAETKLSNSIVVTAVRIDVAVIFVRDGKFIFDFKKAKLDPLCGHFTLIVSRAQVAT